ncbi:hypothetical protein SLE2022_134030 [Rubroshorea leprosula]
MHVASENLEFYMLVSDKDREVASGNWGKEFTVKEEETIMKHTFPPFPLAYSKGGDSILLKVAASNELFWYNFENKAKQRVEIKAGFCSVGVTAMFAGQILFLWAMIVHLMGQLRK